MSTNISIGNSKTPKKNLEDITDNEKSAPKRKHGKSIKKTRRGIKKREQLTEKLLIIGTNANGLQSKKNSFSNLLANYQPQVAMVQETKMKRQGQIAIQGYELLEKLRQDKDGGGLMIGFRTDIEGVPVVVSNLDNDVEILVVEVALKFMTIRFLTGYGPQEDTSEDVLNNFYASLEEEIIHCEQENCGMVAELDCNAKLGQELIIGDPNKMSNNGRLLWEIMERRDCTVVNTTSMCHGVITRSRKKGKVREESVLDYVIVNAIMLPYVDTMEIDETKATSLTRYKKGKAIPSDHNTLKCTFNIPVQKKIPPRTEVYRLRNTEELRQFKDATTYTNRFTKCFSQGGDINQEGEMWMKTLQKSIHSCFKKIRIRNNNPKKDEMQKKMEDRKDLIKKLSNVKSPAERHKLEDQISMIEGEISEEYRKKQIEKVHEHLNEITNPDGRVNTTGVWKLRKKICPKPQEQLSAKKDRNGVLVTDPEKIKDLYLEAYVDRLKHRQILPELQELKVLREQLFEQRLEECKKNKSQPWTMDQLERVLGKLKKGKATDPAGLVNELFMLENIGCNLKESLLCLVNKIKDTHQEPDFMKLANITSFWKGKGTKDDIDNERGVFILQAVRMIKDRLIYNDIKNQVHMSDSQVGGREDYNVRDHLFVIYSVQNSVINKETPPIDIHLYDLCKCFDGLWLEECCNNLYDAGITDDKLAMIYEGNKINNVAVRTPAGLTERKIVERIVTQGGVTGPLCCSVQTDDIGKQSMEKGTHLYMYKGVVGIPTLAMVDDLAKVSLCGTESVKDNAYINAKVEQNKLQFNGPKCHQMHVGKPCQSCPPLRAHTTHMDIVTEEKYIGDVISSDGKHTKNITSRRSKGIGISNEIIIILSSLCLGAHYFDVALMLRRAMLVSVLLFNAETWHRLSKENIKKLESIDLMLLRKLLKTPISTPKPSLYLETGCVPIRYIIKGKRIMYLHHILTRETHALISRVFWAQVQNPGRGDWCQVVREDLDSLGLGGLTFADIAAKSKSDIRAQVIEKIYQVAFEELEMQKKELSKVKNLSYSKLELQPYLTEAKLPTRLKQLAFRWKTRMIRVGWNYGVKEKCPLCLKADDTQTHLLQCEELKNDSINYDHSYDKYDLTEHMRSLDAAIRKREIILDDRSKDKQKPIV